MKSLVVPAALAAIIASSSFALAATLLPASQAAHGSWTVLQNVSDQVCYAADRKAGPGEARVGGAYATESAAAMSIDRIAACDTNSQKTDNG